MSKRRLPKGTDLKFAKWAKAMGYTRKQPKELQHQWISREKRRTHKRERRDGKASIKEQT